jgi:tetratricopeptide (TPR) repeat protein
LAALLLATTGCATKSAAKPEPQRFAILRFENLSADSSGDWMGRALSEILATELSGAPGLSVISSGQFHTFDREFGIRPISAPGISAERTDALAAGANRLGYGDYSVRAGRLSARLSIEDARTGKTTRVISVSTAANEVLGAATDMARQISTKIAPYSTHNLECLKAYYRAVESHDVPATIADLNRAIAADPNFGPPYRVLAELDAEHGDRTGALETIDRATARGNAIDPLERARIAVLAADLHANPAAKESALLALAKLESVNSGTWQLLADLAMNRHDYKQAEDAYRQASELETGNVSLLNRLGYAATYAGDPEAGLAALRRYRQLRPTDPNAIDSLGDLNLIGGHLHEAEELYLEANKVGPNFFSTGPGGDLFKAAMARAMTGDIAGADELEKKFIEARAAIHDPNVASRELDWLWLTGRRKQAYGQLQSQAVAAERDSQRPAASHAYAQLALWSLMAGDRATALQIAQKSAALATQATAPAAFIGRFLAQPSASVEEWTARADRFVPSPAQAALRDQMLAFALLLDGKVKEAAAPLQRIYEVTALGANEGLPVLLAWSHLESGDANAAAQLLKLNPVPPMAGVSTFMPVYFPRIFELRSKVAAKAGKADEAKQSLDLFKKLSGK